MIKKSALIIALVLISHPTMAADAKADVIDCPIVIKMAMKKLAPKAQVGTIIERPQSWLRSDLQGKGLRLFEVEITNKKAAGVESINLYLNGDGVGYSKKGLWSKVVRRKFDTEGLPEEEFVLD